jgi:prepilin-type N-terminal cleavage/methylation domain-containing protein
MGKSLCAPRRGFTLLELLALVTILGIISAVFRLAAREASQHVREPEKPCRRMAHGFARHIRIGIGRITAGIQRLLAEKALNGYPNGRAGQ